jgi:UDP-glucose 4-epimerase
MRKCIEDRTNVETAAETVVREMKFKFTGGVDGERGWKGDVKNMLLDTAKLKSKGWKPRYGSAVATRKTVKHYCSKTPALGHLHDFPTTF